ncbi:hypothetical protein lerEdw1_015530 [Lerista edwardsae]|nr:hypothetical protein lerEdw1_015530 [Lerista edwardsae]
MVAAIREPASTQEAEKGGKQMGWLDKPVGPGFWLPAVYPGKGAKHVPVPQRARSPRFVNRLVGSVAASMALWDASVTTAHQANGASQTAGLVTAMGTRRSVTCTLGSAASAVITQLAATVRGAWMVTMETQSWAPDNNVGPAHALGILGLGIIMESPVMLIGRPTRFFASVLQDIQGRVVTAAHLATLAHLSRRAEPAAPVSATTTSTPVILRPVTRTVANACAAFTTLVDSTVLNASLVTTAMPSSVAADAVLATSKALCSHSALRASVTVIGQRATAPAGPMWWTRIVTDVPPTSGALAVTWDASHAVVTLPIRYGRTATCLISTQFTGQCHCQLGFGGRVCSHCQEDHWGDPELECLACECDPKGSESLQCDRLTGHCLCRAGFTGQRCDQCQRGFRKNFPHCSPCHPCFGQWDVVLGQLWDQLHRLQNTVQALKEGGPIPEASNRRMRKLESNLDHVEQLLGDGSSPSTPLLHHLSTFLADIRADMDGIWQQLQATDSHLDDTEQEAAGQRGRLNALSQELGELNLTVSYLSSQLERMANASFNESFRSILESFRQSEQAQQRANASVHGPESPICGASGEEDCKQSPCGGASCRDSLGQRHCGGPGCTGALPVSMTALHAAQNFSHQLETTTKQLGAIADKVQEIQDLARDARSRAQETLNHAQGARSRVENSTAKLREFIQKIKDFLAEEGADPESIELVAQQVLNISLPSSPSHVSNLLQEIRDRIGQLDGVDLILNSTVHNLSRARELLEKAEQAKEQAEGVQETVKGTRVALDAARDKMKAAEQAMKSSKEAIRNVEGSIRQTERRLQALENKESRLESRLGELVREVAVLRDKSQANQKLAQEAKGKAERATAAAGRLENEVEKVMQRYQKLQDELKTQPEDVLLKLKTLRTEAENLLNKANGSKRKLEELEGRFETNEKEMEEKAMHLQGLEKKVVELLQYIRNNATAYATC